MTLGRLGDSTHPHAQAWGSPASQVSWTCIGFFGTPRHDMCKSEGCECRCHSVVSQTHAEESE